MSAASDLTTASWHGFNRLLDQALELPTDQRLAWIDALGPEHDALKPALRALFERASGVETAWLATLPREAASALIDASDLKPDTSAGIDWCVNSAPAAWARCGSPSAPMAH